MQSKFFATDRFRTIAGRARRILNEHEDYLSEYTSESPRAAGDAIESILADNFQEILGKDCVWYSAKFARRAMEDIAFKDRDGFYYAIDVKTHRKDTKFNMPNLTSVKRLIQFYEDDANYFVLLLVKYVVDGIHAAISDVTFVPIEFLDWDCLTIGALGWGQIQLANSNDVRVRPHYSRREWMLELCDTMLEFYPKEIRKIRKRIDYFKGGKRFWQEKPKQPRHAAR